MTTDDWATIGKDIEVEHTNHLIVYNLPCNRINRIIMAHVLEMFISL